MAVIGPKIIALGETDFIKAQIRPALQIKPLSFHNCENATNKQTANAVNIEPANGKYILCNKLPIIISKDAHNPATTAAFSHTI